MEINLLKKMESGRGVGSEPGRPKPGGLPRLAHPNRYAAVGFRSDGALPFFPAWHRMHASPAVLARVLAGRGLPWGGWWSAVARSAAVRAVRRGAPRECACRGWGGLQR
jgi:hypothetical protein